MFAELTVGFGKEGMMQDTTVVCKINSVMKVHQICRPFVGNIRPEHHRAGTADASRENLWFFPRVILSGHVCSSVNCRDRLD